MGEFHVIVSFQDEISLFAKRERVPLRVALQHATESVRQVLFLLFSNIPVYGHVSGYVGCVSVMVVFCIGRSGMLCY